MRWIFGVRSFVCAGVACRAGESVDFAPDENERDR